MLVLMRDVVVVMVMAMVTSQVWQAPPFLLRSHWLGSRLPRTDVCSLSDKDSCQTELRALKKITSATTPYAMQKTPVRRKWSK